MSREEAQESVTKNDVSNQINYLYMIREGNLAVEKVEDYLKETSRRRNAKE